jgi:hypothetical protein
MVCPHHRKMIVRQGSEVRAREVCPICQAYIKQNFLWILNSYILFTQVTWLSVFIFVYQGGGVHVPSDYAAFNQFLMVVSDIAVGIQANNERDAADRVEEGLVLFRPTLRRVGEYETGVYLLPV